MLMYAIPAYRLPKDIVRKIIRALEGMGIEFKTSTRIGENVMPEELERSFDSVLRDGHMEAPRRRHLRRGLTIFVASTSSLK